MSEAAYERAPGIAASRPQGCPDPVALLEAATWTRWPSFPDSAAKPELKRYHLRVEVWSTRAGVAAAPGHPAVVVAFGGTDAKYIQDWIADFRWFIPKHDDQYTQLVKSVAPDFATEFSRLRATPQWSYLKDALVYTTGHSLGGGLAQQFAYALPDVAQVPRICHVYAFDSSPVTGFYSVDGALRDHNVQALLIDRIYQRDEILAGVRAALAAVYPPSETSPAVRGVRYSLFRGNIIARHSISQLACKLRDLAISAE
jgi:hypothetical protein